MRYRLRTICLILVWVILFNVVVVASAYYGYLHNVENAHMNIRTSLLKVNENLPKLLENEVSIRQNYEKMQAGMGEMIPFLQEKGLEKEVPEQGRLEMYAELLGAEYICITDPEGKTAASWGERISNPHSIPANSAKKMDKWFTSGKCLIPAEEDVSEYTKKLKGGYELLYQISNEYTSATEEEVFSWRSVLRNLTLPSDASLTVISVRDGTILVHPDQKKIGQSYEALGFSSEEAFLSAYEKPNKDGIAYQKSAWDKGFSVESVSSGMNILGRGSGYMKTDDLYVICTVPAAQSAFYVLQQLGIVWIYVLATLLILCYILLHFRYQKRKEKAAMQAAASNPAKAGGTVPADSGIANPAKAGDAVPANYTEAGIADPAANPEAFFGNTDPAADPESFSGDAELTADPARPSGDGMPDHKEGSRFGLVYDKTWSRRMIVCCVFVVVAALLLSLQMEILSNESQYNLQTEQSKKLTKLTKKQNMERRDDLDAWYNQVNTQMAGVLAYVVTRDDSLQTRGVFKDLASRFGVSDIYLFGQNGKMKATNTTYDHVDLYEDKSPRMSQVFLPLLDGQSGSASTPYTLQQTESETADEKQAADNENTIGLEMYIAIAGVSLRNGRDLCNGCLGIGVIPPEELQNDAEPLFYIDSNTFEAVMNLVEVESDRSIIMPTVPQLLLLLRTMFIMVLCCVLFYLLGVARIDRRGKGRRKAPGARAKEPEKWTQSAPTAFADTGEGSDRGEASQTTAASAREQEDLFFSIFGQKRDHFFSDRWNYDSTPWRDRTPEKQLHGIAAGLFFVLFLLVVKLFYTSGASLNENSMLRDVVTGGWEHGVNLYAITASEMVIVVAITMCALLHWLVYFIARFSTSRVETVCHLVYSMISYAAVLVAIYYCLSFFGVHTRTILAGAGILGIVISFGAQSTIADILSGIFLIFEDVIHVGDFVKVAGTMGIIKRVGVRMTKIQSFGTEISINNADLKALENMSNDDGRVSCYLSININENLALVEEVIERELPGIIGRLDETGYITTDIWYSGVTGMEGSAMTLRFDTFCISYRYGRVLRALNAELIRMCQKYGIRMAIPQTVLKEDDPPATLPDQTGSNPAQDSNDPA